jgi:hypothetical protein
MSIENNTGNFKVKFVTQKQGYWSEASCGVAALSMLLKTAKHKYTTPYVTLCEELRIGETHKKKWSNSKNKINSCGAYEQDIRRWLLSKRIYFKSNKTLNCKTEFKNICENILRGPLMIGMAGGKWGNEGHWIVLIGVKGRRFSYLNPYDKNRVEHKLNRNTIEKYGDGTWVQVFRNQD